MRQSHRIGARADVPRRGPRFQRRGDGGTKHEFYEPPRSWILDRAVTDYTLLELACGGRLGSFVVAWTARIFSYSQRR